VFTLTRPTICWYGRIIASHDKIDKKTLRALQAGLGSPEEIAKEAGLPLFTVRSGLRELTEAGLAKQRDDKYELSEKGAKLIK